MEAKRLWSNAYKILKDNNFQPRILSPDILSIECESKIKIFPDRHDSKFYLFCTFSYKTSRWCTLPKQEESHNRVRHRIKQKGIKTDKCEDTSHGWIASNRAKEATDSN